MNFRRAAAEDAEAWARIHHDAWCHAYSGLVPEVFLEGFTLARRRERFLRSLTAGTEETYLIGSDREPFGFLTIGACRDHDLDSKHTGEIWGIYLAPRFWRQGLGTNLVAEAERLLKVQGYQDATLWVLAANQPARRFYEAMGFRRGGGVKIITFGTPMNAVRYRKSLACDA